MYDFFLWANVVCVPANIGMYLLTGHPYSLFVAGAAAFVAGFMWKVR